MIRIVRRRMLINLKNGKAFSGILWKRDRRLLLLRDAVLFEDGQTRPLDGEIIVDRRDVDFMQIVATQEPGT